MQEFAELARGLFFFAAAPGLGKPKQLLAPACHNAETVGGQQAPLFPEAAARLFIQAFDAVTVHGIDCAVLRDMFRAPAHLPRNIVAIAKKVELAFL